MKNRLSKSLGSLMLLLSFLNTMKYLNINISGKLSKNWNETRLSTICFKIHTIIIYTCAVVNYVVDNFAMVYCILVHGCQLIFSNETIAVIYKLFSIKINLYFGIYSIKTIQFGASFSLSLVDWLNSCHLINYKKLTNMRKPKF